VGAIALLPVLRFNRSVPVGHLVWPHYPSEGDMETTAALESLIDREQIRGCLARVARGEDRRDRELIKSGFWSEATVDFGIFAGDFAKYLAWVTPGSPAVLVTQHFLGQSVIELSGASARVETQVMSYHRINMGTEHRDITIGGRYLDRVEERDDVWRIVQRTMMYDWLQDQGQSVNWSHGVMGSSFSADHFVGRAHDDFSEKFFGKRA
jgi:hypothetical protein